MRISLGLAAASASAALVSLSCRAALAAAPAAPPVQPPPPEAFGVVPQMDGAVLSPGGNRLAWIQRDGASPRVVMYDLDTLRGIRNIDGGSSKLRALRWVDDDTLLIEASVTSEVAGNSTAKYEFFRLLAADASGGKVRTLLVNDGNFNYVTGADLVNIQASKPKTVYLSTLDFSATDQQEQTNTRLTGHRKDSGWIVTLFEVNTDSGKAKILTRGSQFTTDWVVDRDGRALARGEWRPERQEYQLLAANGGGWREILQQTDGRYLQLVGPSADGKAILASGSRDEGRAKVWSIPLDGSAPTVLAEDSDRDVTGVGYDSYKLSVSGVWLGGAAAEFHWLDKDMEARHQALLRSFKGGQIDTYQESRDHHKALFREADPSHPWVYYIVDFTTHKADIIGDEYPALANAALGEETQISYTARDGTVIPAYQTLPPGSSGKNLPLVVLPHGGPNSRDFYEFDWLAQFLATRGYAVLQPQFRGSSGFGEAFRKAGEHQWGRLMQDDVTDGVKALIDKGTADPRRVCIVGASYGGYAALAGAAFTPDLYACAVSIGGISDLQALLGYVGRQNGAESDTVVYWRNNIGTPFDSFVIDRSPVHAAAVIKAPILLIHGTDDTVVPIGQSELMARALQAASKPVSFVKLPSEDHWLSRTETRVRVLKEIEPFLDRYLKAP